MSGNKKTKTAIIILAAGQSKRMGTLKQNLPWKRTTLLGHAIEQGINSIADHVFVVLSSNSKAIINKTDSGNITTISNPDWESGMGTSIARAMHYLDKNSLYFDAVLIALSDQPLIEYKHYNNLINSLFKNNKTIAATQFDNRAGVPAIFSSQYFSLLSKLHKDHGARKILSKHEEEIQILNIDNKIIDLDTMDAYKHLYKKYGIA